MFYMGKGVGILWEEEYVPKGALLLERGQITREMMAMYIDCRGCKDKGVLIYKNQE